MLCAEADPLLGEAEKNNGMLVATYPELISVVKETAAGAYGAGRAQKVQRTVYVS